LRPGSVPHDHLRVMRLIAPHYAQWPSATAFPGALPEGLPGKPDVEGCRCTVCPHVCPDVPVAEPHAGIPSTS
jgi:hypothetical protein